MDATADSDILLANIEYVIRQKWTKTFLVVWRRRLMQRNRLKCELIQVCGDFSTIPSHADIPPQVLYLLSIYVGRKMLSAVTIHAIANT